MNKMTKNRKLMVYMAPDAELLVMYDFIHWPNLICLGEL